MTFIFQIIFKHLQFKLSHFNRRYLEIFQNVNEIFSPKACYDFLNILYVLSMYKINIC